MNSKFLTILGVLMGVLFATKYDKLGWPGFFKKSPARIRAERQATMSPFERKFDDKLAATIPEYEKQFAGLEGPDAYGQVYTKAFSMVTNGMNRLDDEALLARLDLHLELLNIADIYVCGSLFRPPVEFDGGRARREKIFKLVEELPSDLRNQWIDLSVASASAEIRQNPPKKSVSDVELQKTLLDVLATLGPEDHKRIMNDLRIMPTLGDEEACWAARTMYSLIGRTADRNAKAIIARGIASTP